MKKLRGGEQSRRLCCKETSTQRGSRAPSKITLPDGDTSLSSYVPFINDLLRKKIAPGLEEEVKDVSQAVLITLWLKLSRERVKIDYPKMYIRSIVRSRWIDAARQRQRQAALPLPETEDGDLTQGKALLFLSEGMDDPALEYERKEFLSEVLDEIVQLPSMQMKAMICVLKDEVGETFPLVEEFAKRGVDIQSTVWPDDSHKRQKLMSSLSPARQKLRSMKQK